MWKKSRRKKNQKRKVHYTWSVEEGLKKLDEVEKRKGSHKKWREEGSMVS